jgi:hypothetical protein
MYNWTAIRHDELLSTILVVDSLRDKYRDEGPFVIDAAGEKLLVTHDPEHIKRILRSSTELDANAFLNKKIFGNVMGSPQAAVDYYLSNNGVVNHTQIAHVRKHTSGANLAALDKKYFETLKRNVEASLADAEWTDIADLWSFILHHVIISMAETLLGSAIVSRYPDLDSDLWVVVEQTDYFFMGLPRFCMPKGYAARDRLLSHLREWCTDSESLRQENRVDTKWDAVVGSGFVQEREVIYSELPGHDVHARAAQALGLMYGATSFTVPISFWMTYETLRDTALRDRVLAELKSSRDVGGAGYDHTQLGTRPLLQSMHAEGARLYSSNLVAREVVTPTYALDDKHNVEKGVMIIMPSKYIGQDEPAWAAVRRQTVARPLDTYWAERWITGDKEKGERFSDVGLGANWLSFGGGAHKCPGRWLARDTGIATLAVLLGECEVEIGDVEAARKLEPAINEMAFGPMKPSGKIAARIRRRRE